MSNSSSAFSGFSKDAFDFLAELSRNNNKAWFTAHRGVYEAAIVEPALLFVEAMGAALQGLAPSVKPEPRVGGSLFRINRDVRFSADKAPYKTHVGIRFRDGDTTRSSKCSGPLFYVELGARSLRLGVGVKEFDPRSLAAYRDLVGGATGAPRERAVLDAMVRLAGQQGCEILGPLLARPPKGYPEGASPDLLLRKGLFICSKSALPREIQGPAFVGYCERWFRPFVPLFDSLRSVACSTLDTAV